MPSLFRSLLLLYPKAFRQEYEREMALVLRDRLREASGPMERAFVWLNAIAGVLTQAPKEHFAMLGQDLRYALRTLRQSPGFALAAILTLAIGIGANTAVFSVVDAMLLRPLPYPDADRLVMLWEKKRDLPNQENIVAPANLLDWRARTRTLEQLAMFRLQRVSLTGSGEPVEIQSHSVDREFFPALRIKPHRGRLLTAADDRPGAPKVLVISYRLWQQRFGGDEALIGQSLRVNAAPATVVGVLPQEFQFMGPQVDAWTPLGLNEARNWRKDAGRFVNAFARLKPGSSVDEARRELNAIAQQLEREHPDFNTGWGVNIVPLRDQVAGKVRTALWALLVAVGLLLVIACTNVANLLLARAAARQREIAIRLAIGANRARLIRQLLTESLILSIAGAAGGIAIAWAGVRTFWALRPLELGSPNPVAVDARVLLFSVLLAILTGILFGLAPVITSLRADVQRVLKEGGRGAVGRSRHVRAMFVVAQCALTVVLLVGAGLLLRSFLKLQSQDPGLNASNLLTLRVSLPGATYGDAARRVKFFEQAVAGIEALPQVRSASAAAFLPFTGDAAGTYVHVQGQPFAQPGKELLTVVRVVLPKYFETTGIPVRKGRSFQPDDNRESAPLRYVVNQEFVRKYLPGVDPLRQRISVLMRSLEFSGNPYAEIIGVVGDVREGALDKAPEPTVYYPHAQLNYNAMTFVIRTQGDPLALAKPVRDVIRSLDPNQPVSEVRTMEQVLGRTVERQRFAAALLIAFSSIALLLAAVGVYSVLSYVVAERSQEVGVRMALGARPGDVLGLVMRQGLGWALVGLGIGIFAAVALGRYLRALLFEIEPTDWVTLSAVGGLLLAVGIIATLLPAWRAASLDPLTVLRQE
jgi:putative ABC transport system permease protein